VAVDEEDGCFVATLQFTRQKPLNLICSACCVGDQKIYKQIQADSIKQATPTFFLEAFRVDSYELSTACCSATGLKKASPDIRKHCADCRMRQVRFKSSRSSSRKLLVLLLLAYPTLVAAPNSSSVGDSSLSTSTISAAAALVIGVNSYVHRTRKWARDESRIKASCLKYEVQYTPPEINENQQDQSKRRSRLKEECRMHQKRKRRSKRAEDEKKKRSLETPVEKARHAEYKKEKRSSETPEEKMRRNEQKAQRMKEKRSAEDRAYELDDDIMINGVVPFIDVSLEGVKKARSLLTPQQL